MRGAGRRRDAVVLVVALAATLVAPATVGAAPADIAPACPDEAVPAGAFDDTGTSVHATAVDCAFRHDVVRGVSALHYAPGRALRRDQLASVLVRLVRAGGGGLPAGSPGRFDDVDGNVHAGAIAQLAGAGIVEGRDGTSYAPSRPVRRDQMATLLVRVHEHVTGQTLPEGDARFGDVDDGNTHAASVRRASGAGLVTGTAPGAYEPGAPVRRDQLARLVARLLSRFVEEGHAAPPRRGHAGGARPLPPAVRAFMAGRSWRPGCPVGLDALALVTATHRGFDGRDHWGRLVVHVDVAGEVVQALRRLYEAGFPIARMRLVDHYGGDDGASMADNNSSAFNCRPVTGGASWSQHSYGSAVDLNPVQNPYVRDGTVLPAAGRAYVDRTDVREGMIVRPGPVTDTFAALGWRWGGDWRSVHDPMHFER